MLLTLVSFWVVLYPLQNTAAYSDYLKQSRRNDAREFLMSSASRLERCFTLEGVYDGSCVLRENSEQGYYSLSADRERTAFVLTAVPGAKGNQSSDIDCGSPTIDNLGRKSATGDLGTACW